MIFVGIMEKMRLDGKKIFVTGGARGIGMNYAKAVAEAGADVAIVDLDIATAEETARYLAAMTGREFIALTPCWRIWTLCSKPRRLCTIK